MMEDLKQTGTWHDSREVLKMSVNTGVSSSAQCASKGGGGHIVWSRSLLRVQSPEQPVCILLQEREGYSCGRGGVVRGGLW